MIWNLVNTGENTGIYNMEYDLNSVENCLSDNAYFRIYRWKPYCISLGYTQSIEDVDVEKAGKDNIDVVRRPTGGRAILHADEITYSVVMPLTDKFTAKEVYTKISLALVKGLKEYDLALKNVELENIQPDFAEIHKQPSGMICFASTAKSEIKFNGKKLVGSAQRKIGRFLLQHGSILCGNYHRNLIKYLKNIDEYSYKVIKNEFSAKTIELDAIVNDKINYEKLTECLITGFKKEWGIEFLSV
ncbi:MAG: hypothetical protein V1773_10515 [bacterium]